MGLIFEKILKLFHFRSILGGPKISKTAWLGRKGEKQACRYLKKNGYRILRHNFRCESGEIDLIAQDGPEVVFVEVKTRRNEDYIQTEKVVNNTKQKRIRSAARYFIRRFKLQYYQPRYDIIVVIWPVHEKPEIRHTLRAF